MERRTARLALHPLGPAHLPEIAAMHEDPRVMATLGGLRSREESERFVDAMAEHWARRGFGLWVTRERETGAFAGRGGLHAVDVLGRAEVEVAYALLPPFWGRGLATELAAASVRVAFDELGLADLVAFALVDNRASQRVMEKLGFRYENDLERAGLLHRLFRLRAEPKETR
jgi:RimJ/RimL family protein N-acetyltransferase